MPLGELATIDRGGSFQKKDYGDGSIHCIHYGQIYTYYKTHTSETLSRLSEDYSGTIRWANPNDIIMAVTSENIDDVCKSTAWLGGMPIAVSGHTAIIRHSQNPKYLSYFFSSTWFQNEKRKYAQGTKVIEVSPKRIGKVLIPIPSLEEQERIVAILDKFDALVNDISQGLPAEIEARRKQYEYYRDKLLTFKEKAA